MQIIDQNYKILLEFFESPWMWVSLKTLKFRGWKLLIDTKHAHKIIIIEVENHKNKNVELIE